MLIHGTVRDGSGDPIDGAAVVFVDAPTDVPDVGALTGDDGSFVMFAPVPGRYRLSIRSDAHAVRDLDVLVGEGADVVASVELAARPPRR